MLISVLECVPSRTDTHFLTQPSRRISGTIEPWTSTRGTKQLWDSKASDYADQLASRIRAAEPDVEKAARQFREWKPLRFYISVSGASGVPSFSVRFRGQEVARLKVAPIPTIHVDSKHERATSKYFGLDTPVWKEAASGPVQTPQDSGPAFGNRWSSGFWPCGGARLRVAHH